MKRINSLNTRRVLKAVSEPLKKKGVVIEPGGEAEQAIRTGVKAGNRGIRAVNEMIVEGEKLVDDLRERIHRATAPKPKAKAR